MRDSERCGRRKTDPSTGSFQFEIQINIQRESPPLPPLTHSSDSHGYRKVPVGLYEQWTSLQLASTCSLVLAASFCLPPPSRGETEATRGSADARRSLKGSGHFLSERVRALRRCGRYHLGEALDAELLFATEPFKTSFPRTSCGSLPPNSSCDALEGSKCQASFRPAIDKIHLNRRVRFQKGRRFIRTGVRDGSRVCLLPREAALALDKVARCLILF